MHSLLGDCTFAAFLSFLGLLVALNSTLGMSLLGGASALLSKDLRGEIRTLEKPETRSGLLCSLSSHRVKRGGGKGYHLLALS